MHILLFVILLQNKWTPFFKRDNNHRYPTHVSYPLISCHIIFISASPIYKEPLNAAGDAGAHFLVFMCFTIAASRWQCRLKHRGHCASSSDRNCYRLGWVYVLFPFVTKHSTIYIKVRLLKEFVLLKYMFKFTEGHFWLINLLRC